MSMRAFKVALKDGVELTEDLSKDITSFMKRYEGHVPPVELKTTEEKAQYILDKMNTDLESLDYPFRIIAASGEETEIPPGLVDLLKRLGQHVKEGDRATVSDDPMVIGMEAIEFGAKKYLNAFAGTETPLAHIMTTMSQGYLHTMAAIISQGVDDPKMNIFELRKVVLRMTMLSMMDHYVNSINSCELLKDFGIQKEELLADIHAVGLNRVKPLMERLSDKYNSLIVSEPAPITETAH